MIAALGLLAALQGAPPDVTARVDRARLTAGEELRLTVRARSRTAEPVTVVLPALTGFAITGSREVTEVTIEGLGAPVRTTTRELALRAQRPGTLVIGPVRVRQGGHEVATAPITVTVDSAAVGLATALSPIARGLLDAAPPPARNDQVAVTVIVPGDSVLVGQQVDVIAAAWFPREVRERLRRAPILTMQTPEGVWAYPGAAPTAVAASRLVRGRWMDLFVAHQAVFPLTRGLIVIPIGGPESQHLEVWTRTPDGAWTRQKHRECRFVAVADKPPQQLGVGLLARSGTDRLGVAKHHVQQRAAHHN